MRIIISHIHMYLIQKNTFKPPFLDKTLLSSIVLQSIFKCWFWGELLVFGDPMYTSLEYGVQSSNILDILKDASKFERPEMNSQILIWILPPIPSCWLGHYFTILLKMETLPKCWNTVNSCSSLLEIIEPILDIISNQVSCPNIFCNLFS